MDNMNRLTDATEKTATLRAEWTALVAAGKLTKARRVAEDLEFWSNKAAFLAAAK